MVLSRLGFRSCVGVSVLGRMCKLFGITSWFGMWAKIVVDMAVVVDTMIRWYEI